MSPLKSGDTLEMPCPTCLFENTLTLVIRFEITEAGKEGRFSISGAQMKLPARQWAYLVCSNCGYEARAKE